MIKNNDLAFYQKSADYIRSKIGFEPELALILGTGLGGLAEEIKNPTVIPYEDIPNFLLSTVDSHAGKLVVGELHGKKVICMSGRFHYYEGYDFTELASPVRIFHLLGVKKLIVTNAAGAINTDYRPGDVMIIRDHINLAMAAPTRGMHVAEFGARFFDLGNAYDREWRELALELGKESSLKIHQGVYVYVVGPHYETPSEIKFFRLAGGDAVGMSTIPEVIAAAQCGMRTLGISLMTNMAAGILPTPLDGKEVEEVGARSKNELGKYLKTILKRV